MLIGVNYEGTEWALRGCHNDVRKMRGYLTQNCGFSKDPEHMRLLIDDGVQVSSPLEQCLGTET